MERMKKAKGNIGKMFRTSGTRHGLQCRTYGYCNRDYYRNQSGGGQIPEAYRNLDVSSTKIYDISDTTTELLDSLEEDVDMTILAVKDETDDRINTFLSKYDALRIMSAWSGWIRFCILRL